MRETQILSVSDRTGKPGGNWIKFMNTATAERMPRESLAGFTLLMWIAYKMRLDNSPNVHGLRKCEAFLWPDTRRTLHLTENQFRNAKRFLATRRHATFRRAYRGTIARLVSRNVFAPPD